jgi:hypothetical protein
MKIIKVRLIIIDKILLLFFGCLIMASQGMIPLPTVSHRVNLGGYANVELNDPTYLNTTFTQALDARFLRLLVRSTNITIMAHDPAIQGDLIFNYVDETSDWQVWHLYSTLYVNFRASDTDAFAIAYALERVRGDVATDISEGRWAWLNKHNDQLQLVVNYHETSRSYKSFTQDGEYQTVTYRLTNVERHFSLTFNMSSKVKADFLNGYKPPGAMY